KIESSEVYREPGSRRFGAPKVALIDVDGLISHVAPPGVITPRANTVDSVVARLQEAERDSSVRAVILRVNSPGGTVAATDTLYHEIRRFRERSNKPVVVSMAEVAASGGYYVSLAADHIVAQPSTVTGSIGVIFQTFNVSDGLAMIGIRARAITSDRNKAIASPFEPAQAEHYEILQSIVDDFYDTFLAKVIERRPEFADADLDTATDGRVFTGTQALNLGLVDELGTLYDAFEAAKRLAQLGPSRLVKYHAEGIRVNSPYAAAPDIRPSAADRRIDISLLKLEQDHFSTGFYYLWRP
ncbi:MAG: signal peptide peptidase SppA, partial [Phycisphaerales bacterium]